MNLQTDGTVDEWEVVSIESTDKDGQVAATEDYRGPVLPIWQGRIVLRPLG